jgi:hypothetical protein
MYRLACDWVALSRCIVSTLFLDLGTRRVEGSASRPGRFLPPGKNRYPWYRRLGGPQDRSGQVRKISPPPGFDPRTFQPVPVAIPPELPAHYYKLTASKCFEHYLLIYRMRCTYNNWYTACVLCLLAAIRIGVEIQPR